MKDDKIERCIYDKNGIVRGAISGPREAIEFVNVPKEIMDELRQLRAEKEIWLKIVNYDKERYQRMWGHFTGTSISYIFPKEDRDHLKNLNELVSDKCQK